MGILIQTEASHPEAREYVTPSGRVVMVRTIYEGATLFGRELNGYDDSDFYVISWDDTKGKPVQISTGSTRYGHWAGTVESPWSKDATPEVWEKYNAWNARKIAEARAAGRSREAKELLEVRAKLWQVAKLAGVSFAQACKLRRTLPSEAVFDQIFTLLTSTKLRSEFKLSLRQQVLEWLQSPGTKLRGPLTDRQITALVTPFKRWG
jgi:hypothetical protein